MKPHYVLMLAVSSCPGLYVGNEREVDSPWEDGSSTDAAGDVSITRGNSDSGDTDRIDSKQDADTNDSKQDAGTNDALVRDIAIDFVDTKVPDASCDECTADASLPDAPIDRAPVDIREEVCGTSVCEIGAIQCDARGGFVCEQRGACTTWVQRLDCPEKTFCCATESQLRCVAPDSQNCFGCGRTCAGETPSCSDDQRKCVCDRSSCPLGEGCDRATGICSPCMPLAPDAADFYVDFKASALGNASALCPVPTISAALTLAKKSKSAAKTIHINDGVYTAVTETFPLVLDSGITLEGSGADKVSIVGLGFFRSDAPMTGNEARVTVVIGASNSINVIRGVTILPGEVVRAGSVGVAVVDGNIPVGDAGIPDNPPNSVVADSIVGPGFNVGINMLASIASGSGGNVRVQNSRVLGSWAGIYAWGCSDQNQVDYYGRIDVSNSVMSGHTTGIEIYGCTSLSVKQSVFRDSISGVRMRFDSATDKLPQRIEVLSNTFEKLTEVGLGTLGTIAEISGNTFSSVVSDFHGPALALLLESGSVLRARSNRFIGNDAAIAVWFHTPFDMTSVFDFGTPSDPGQNHFRCNSASLTRVAEYKGFDVCIDPAAPPGWIFNLYGNGWDHAVPFVMTGAGIHDNEPDLPDGADLYIGNGKPISSVDLGGAFRSSAPCSGDHAEGPPSRPQEAGVDAGVDASAD